VLCVGAGAVGGTVAARLARHGADITVLDTDEEHVRLLRDPGLIVGGLESGEPTPLDATSNAESVHAADVVLLSVRSQSTDAALASIAPALGHTTDVVSLQNGLNEDRIASVVGAGRTIGCVVGIGATWIEPGHIELNAEGDLTIGRLDGSSDGRLEAVAELLHGAFPTKISANVRGDLWAKMLVNSMTVLGALGGMLTGELLLTPERRRIIADVVAEGVRVARSEGVNLPDVFGLVPPGLVDHDRWHEVMQRVLARVGEAYGAIKSVTWRDFELGRPTEIDAVTGEIVRRGERNGIPVPLSSAVYAMLHQIETGARKPDPANFDSLVTTAS
jgi:2-dehydropantoate 2-reductase